MTTMKLIDILNMGVGNLLRRKTRTLLTVLGVVIGAASIIIMLSIGFGLKEGMHAQLGGAGSLTIIQVQERGAEDDDGTKNRQKKKPVINTAALKAFGAIENVVAVTPQKSTFLHFMSGKYVANVNVVGIDAAQMEAFGFKVKEGALVKPGEDGIVFGHHASYSFFDPRRDSWAEGDDSRPPLVDVMNGKMKATFDLGYEETIRNNEGGLKPKVYKVKVVSITTPESEGAWSAYMDLAALQKLIKDKEKYDPPVNDTRKKEEKYEAALVKADKIENVLAVQDVIKEMGYKTSSAAEYVKSIESSFNTLQLALGGIGAISLIVAAIGITNTMVMSIYERTREIGVMKVVGAAIKDIKILFLLESGLIGLGGGLLGVILSYITSYLINSLIGQSPEGPGTPTSIIPLWLAAASLGVSFAVGVLSGYLPAQRAMKLSALQAIKTD
jgi:ABC-type antimicrobial peptide transport system permease subunit